ncbi:MAG TPA: endonuclease/exonuclease/phosphatase family protein [Bryobacteraceae bacterium]|nr:endonuclease/exonuclease/phosphatase family protein [Bryobacteraceae bacterium]
MEQLRSGRFATRDTSPNGILRVLDWNIDRGYDLPGISNAIEGQRPDLVILQEVDLNARRTHRADIAAELARRLKLDYVFAPEFQELSQGSSDDPAYHGQAILTSLPVLRSRMIRFQHQSGFWQPRPYVPSWALFQRRLGGRIALVSELQYHARTLVVYNLHLESRSAGAIQLAQLDEVLKDSGQYPKETPIVIAGDLNTKYRACTKAVMERLRAAGFENATGDRTPRTHVIVGSLDYIFARGPLRIGDGEVRRDIHKSDHYPVSAQLTIH